MIVNGASDGPSRHGMARRRLATAHRTWVLHLNGHGPTVVEHGLNAADASNFHAGLGIGGIIPHGVPAGVSPDVSHGGVVVNEVVDYTGASTMADCKAYLMGRGAPPVGGSVSALATGMLGVWHEGTCRSYRAVRSPLQFQLWSAWATFAQSVTRLGHFIAPDAAATRVPDDSTTCDHQLGSNCTTLWWAEFDDSTYSCRPTHGPTNMLENVLTPLRMIETLQLMQARYPPPSPPPPLSPSPPSPPPPPPLRCSDDELPTLPSLTHQSIRDADWKCW